MSAPTPVVSTIIVSAASASFTPHFHGDGAGPPASGGLSSGALTAIMFIVGAVSGILVAGMIYLVVRRVRRDRQMRRRDEKAVAAANMAVGLDRSSMPPTPPPKQTAIEVFGARAPTAGWNDPPPQMMEVSKSKGSMTRPEFGAYPTRSSDSIRGVHKKNANSSVSSLATSASSTSLGSQGPLIPSGGALVYQSYQQPSRPPGLQTLAEQQLLVAESSAVQIHTTPSSPISDRGPTATYDGPLSARMRRPPQAAQLSPPPLSAPARDSVRSSKWYPSPEEPLPALTNRHTRNFSGASSGIMSLTEMNWPMPPPPPIPIPPIPIEAQREEARAKLRPPPLLQGLPSRPRMPTIARSRANSQSKLEPQNFSTTPTGYV